MNTRQLKSMAIVYKNAIVAKRTEVEKIVTKLKEIPATEIISEKAKPLKTEIKNLNKSLSALMERFDIYYTKLKESGGDLSGLEI